MANREARTVSVIGDAASAAVMLHPLRLRILEALREPSSATSLAERLGLPRQKVNYHLRELERHDLAELVEERRKGNCTERILRAKARYYVISPRTVGVLAVDPAEVRDRFSSAYLTAVAGKAIDDLGVLRHRADRAGKRLPTFSLETEVRFATADSRAAFTEELAEQVASLVARYHDEQAEGGRRFRFFLGAYPKLPGPSAKRRGPGREPRPDSSRERGEDDDDDRHTLH